MGLTSRRRTIYHEVKTKPFSSMVFLQILKCLLRLKVTTHTMWKGLGATSAMPESTQMQTGHDCSTCPSCRGICQEQASRCSQNQFEESVRDVPSPTFSEGTTGGLGCFSQADKCFHQPKHERGKCSDDLKKGPVGSGGASEVLQKQTG